MSRNPTIPQVMLEATVGDQVVLGTIDITASGTPVDTSTRTYTAQVRPSPGAATAVDITVDATGAATGHYVLSIDLTDTDATPGTWWWDIVEELASGSTETLAGGPFSLGARITEVL